MIRPVFIFSVQFTVICSDEHPNIQTTVRNIYFLASVGLSLFPRHQDIVLANHRLVQRWHFYHTCYHVFFHIQTACVLKLVEPFPSVIAATKTYFKTNHVVFLTTWFLCLNLTAVLWREKTENSTWTNFKLRPVWVRLWFYRIVANISSGDCVGLIPQQCLIWLHL